MAALIPEIFKSIQVRLRQIRDQYVARTSPNEVFELEELARESYDALSRVNKNLLRMIEIERSLNSASKLTGSTEMRMCRQLLKEIAQLSGVDSALPTQNKIVDASARKPVQESHSRLIADQFPETFSVEQIGSADAPPHRSNGMHTGTMFASSGDSGATEKQEDTVGKDSSEK
ncbi:MAG: hypothetical protein JWQ23_4640 [Herminiimonas sp.]|nr:hypothetical protein [Herminiimonas sp.]